jgi:hypothetical protein
MPCNQRERFELGGSDPFAVHCPHCGALPDERCVNDEGEPRQTPHAWRVQLAHACCCDDPNNRRRQEADAYIAECWERYGAKVDATRVLCSPSATQYRWRALWNTVWGQFWRTEDEAEAAHKAAHEGVPCMTVGDDETPAAEALAAGPPPTVALGPGALQERLGDAIAKAQRQERARRRR